MKRIILFLLLFAVFISAGAQEESTNPANAKKSSVAENQKKDGRKKTTEVAATSKSRETAIQPKALKIFEISGDKDYFMNFSKSNIVDINSGIEIQIDKDSLLKMANISSGINESLLARLTQFNVVLQKQKEILETLNSNIKQSSLEGSIAALGEASTLVYEFYTSLENNKEVEDIALKYYKEYQALRKQDNLDRSEYPGPETYMIKNLSRDAENLLLSIEQSDDFKKLSFELVAFLNTRKENQRKVHILNFDTFSEGEFYEVDTWVTSFSEKDKEEFNRTKQIADQLNVMLEKGTTDLKSMLKNNLQSLQCLETNFNQLKEISKNPGDFFGESDADKGKTELANLEIQINIINPLIQNLNLSQLNSLSGENLLGSFNELQNRIKQIANELPKLLTLTDQLSMAKPGSSDALSTLVDDLKACALKVEADLKAIEKIFEFTTQVISPIQNTVDIAEDIGGKATAFSYEDLPDFGYIDLKTTGKRENGDELHIMLKMKTEKDKTENLPGQVLELKILKLQQVNIYSITKVTLILAIPAIASQPDLPLLEKNRVQFAPSGSLLFKWGSRYKPAWNFISMGVGFNMSTPDFNLDGSPDVGMGVIVTLFKDILSGGFSYNTTTNSFFGFVGLSIPLALPGVPINNVQSD